MEHPVAHRCYLVFLDLPADGAVRVRTILAVRTTPAEDEDRDHRHSAISPYAEEMTLAQAKQSLHSLFLSLLHLWSSLLFLTKLYHPVRPRW